MMKIIIFLFFILSFGVKAESIPLPPSISSIDDIVEDFRNTLSTKLVDIAKTFIAVQADRTIVFKHSFNLNCHGIIVPFGEPVSKMQYSFSKADSELREKSVYTGCQNQISLVEDVFSRGTNLSPLKYLDFLKGKRDFDLGDNENYRLYRLSNSDNEEIFKVLIEKSENSKLAEFYILGQKFLRIIYEFEPTKTKATFTYYGYKATYARKYQRWDFNTAIDTISNSIIVSNGSFNQVKFLDSTGQPFSQNEFLTTYNKRITSGATQRIRSMIEYHNIYFPTTVQIQSGSANDHLKEELRVAYNRLQNNTELPLVKLQIQEYINAAAKGLLIDNRPKP